MKTFAFCLFTFCFLLSIGCRPAAAPVSVSNRPTNAAPIPSSKPITEMSWTDQTERVQKVSDLKGRAVILDFWATYCEPCKREIPHLNALLAKYGSDLQVVGLNVGGAEDYPKIPEFIRTTKIDYSIAFPEEELSRYIFAERTDIPQTLVLDRRGNIVKKIIGFNPQIQAELDAAVEQAINSQPPA